MNYILIGLGLAIGWHIVKLVYEVVAELLFTRLHNTTWYLVVAGKKPMNMEEQPGDIKAVKNQIGFR